MFHVKHKFPLRREFLFQYFIRILAEMDFYSSFFIDKLLVLLIQDPPCYIHGYDYVIACKANPDILI